MDLKRNLFIILITNIFLILNGAALSAEKSVIVGFHQKPGPSEKALIHGAKGIIKRTYNLIPAMAASLSEEAVAQIRKDKKVAYVEEDGIFMAVEPLPGYEYIDAWGVQHIGADVAHASGNKGAGIKIAVIDTGIDYNHEDLDDNYSGGYDFVFNDSDPFDDNRYSHGTHVAGVIAAEENGIGVIGVAPEAELYAVKVLDGGGFGLLSWIIAGIEWAVNNQMDIINLSLEGRDFQSLQDACDSAYNAGVLLVAAGGNTYGGSVRYPAAYDSVITATGTDSFDFKAYFSPVDPDVEVAAPGLNILSTCSMTQQDCAASGGYRLLSGTSQAAPHVTGTAALFLSSEFQDVSGDGIINHEDVRQMLQTTAVDLGEEGRDTTYGFGLVNAAAAFYPADELSFTISRTSGHPKNDVETVPMSGLYEIKIENHGLSKVKVDAFEDGIYQQELSSSHSFGDKNQQDIIFYIDADGTDYDITFTPFGKPGTSANILINIE
ncbi:MAG: S8 family serine peptidase [Nitrospirota bacterium]